MGNSAATSRSTRVAFAVMAVAMMAMVPFTFAGGESEAAADPLPIIASPQDYVYILTNDDRNAAITNVEVWTGDDLELQTGTYRNNKTMGSFWKYDSNGVGPFNSFYAAINCAGGDIPADDAREPRFSKEAGKVAYVLDPGNLRKTVAGNDYTLASYNIMLVLPAVYWVSDANHLYMSNKPFSGNLKGAETVYTVPEGMKAYAHTHTTAAGKEEMSKYIGLGVYEGSMSGDVLRSATGGSVVSNKTHNQFMAAANANASAPGSAYQVWNYYHWTLYKMMAYTVMGTKDAITMFSNKYAGTTGTADSRGWVYGGSSGVTSKLFLESTWMKWEFLGDSYFYRNLLAPSVGAFVNLDLYAGNSLGGSTIAGPGQKIIPDATFSSRNRVGTSITSTNTSTISWDLPSSVSDTASTGLDKTGSGIFIDEKASSHQVCAIVGSVGLASMQAAQHVDNRWDSVTARLAYVMSEDAFSVTVTYEKGDSAGEGGTVPEAAVAPLGGKISLSDKGGLTNSTPGYEFLGWEKEGVVLSPGDAYPLTGPVTVRSHWEYPQVRITFDPNGGTAGTMDMQTVGLETPTKIRTNAFERQGYKFEGWTGVFHDRTIDWSDGEIVTFLEHTGAVEELTVRAQWVGIRTLFYDAAGGSAPAPSPVEAIPGQDVLLSYYFGQRHGYDFAGWSYSGTVYAPGTMFAMPGTDVTMVAVWDKDAPVVEEDEDDIFDLLRAHPQPSADRSYIDWLPVAIGAAIVAVSSCLLAEVWRRYRRTVPSN